MSMSLPSPDSTANKRIDGNATGGTGTSAAQHAKVLWWQYWIACYDKAIEMGSTPSQASSRAINALGQKLNMQNLRRVN